MIRQIPRKKHVEFNVLNTNKKGLSQKYNLVYFITRGEKSADGAFNMSINMEYTKLDTNNMYKRTGRWMSSSTLRNPLTKYELQENSLYLQVTVLF